MESGTDSRLLFRPRVVNSYSIGVAQQNDISLLADDRIKTIDFFLGRHNGFGDFPACRYVSGSNDELAQCRLLNMTCGNRVPCYPKPAMVPSDRLYGNNGSTSCLPTSRP